MKNVRDPEAVAEQLVIAYGASYSEAVKAAEAGDHTDPTELMPADNTYQAEVVTPDWVVAMAEAERSPRVLDATIINGRFVVGAGMTALSSTQPSLFEIAPPTKL